MLSEDFHKHFHSLLQTIKLRVIAVFAGIEPRGNMVLKPAEFLVETVEAGLGEVLVYVEDPEGHTEEVQTHPHINLKGRKS